MLRPVDVVRTLIFLFACFAATQAMATDITFTMSGSGVYCAGGNASVNYTVTTVTINGGNVFTAQLSDATGSFAAPTSIGTLSSASSTGVIPVTFPGGALGSGYKIRVTSSNSAFIGTPGTAFIIDQPLTASVSITADPSTTLGATSDIFFKPTVTNGGSAPAFQWKKNGISLTTAQGGNNDAYVLERAKDGDQIEVVVTPFCAGAATSNTIGVTIDPDMTRSNHSWEKRTSQPGAFINRSNASGFAIGGKAYVACGTSSTTQYHKDVWEYNPVTDTWSQKADLLGVGRYNAVGFAINTKGYIGMGVTAGGLVKDFYEFDPIGNQWFTRNSLPGVAREQAFGFGVAGKGYIGGGVAAGADLQDFYEFDPSAGNLWNAKPNFAGGKRIGAGAFTIGSKGYVVGGYSSSSATYYNDLYEYDPAIPAWTARASMPGSARTRPTTFALGGNGYVGAGYSSAGYDATFYKWDPVTDSWTQKPFYPGPATKNFGVGLTVGNRSFVYKDGVFHEFDLFGVPSFPSKFCSTESVAVSYDVSGFSFNGGNTITAQLSPTQSFTVVTGVGSKITSASNGTINITIPPGMLSGSYYFRLSSSNPQMVTLLDSIVVTRVETNHVVTADGGTSVCVGVPVTFSSNLTGTGFTWYKNDIGVGSDSPTYLASDLVDQDEIKAVKRYTAGCNAPVDITSNPVVTMTIRTPPTPEVSVLPPNILQSSSATAYQWYKDDVAISNAKSQTYQMTENGTYKVKITDATGCSVFSDDQVNVFTGLEGGSYDLDVLTYPSPFRETMYLSVADHIVSQGCDFTLMDELGQTLIDKQRAQAVNKLDLTARTPGMYILHISFGHTTIVRKLVKMN